MTDAVVGLAGALIGGLAAMGGSVLQARAAERQGRMDAERRQSDAFRTLAQRYLFQLQDAVHSLDARLENWTARGGEGYAESRGPGYWQITSLYAVGRALAAERILDLEGVYVQLETTISPELKRRQVEDAVRRAMGNDVFYYDRLALGESVLERGPAGFQLLTYSEFRRRFADPNWDLTVALQPVIDSLAGLSDAELNVLRTDLGGLTTQLAAAMIVARPSRGSRIGENS